MKTGKKAMKRITAEELDAKFDRGEDVSDYFDWDNATRTVNLNIPVWALKKIDNEAKRRGIPRHAILLGWIIDNVDSLAIPLSATEKEEKKRATG